MPHDDAAQLQAFVKIIYMHNTAGQDVVMFQVSDCSPQSTVIYTQAG